MNISPPIQGCAVANFVGHIGAIPLLIVTLWIPCTSVAVLAIVLLRLCRDELPANLFHTALVGLMVGIFQLVCTVFYHSFASLRHNNGELIGALSTNLASLEAGALFLIVIIVLIYIINIILDGFLDVRFIHGYPGKKTSEVSVANDLEIRQTETDGIVV